MLTNILMFIYNIVYTFVSGIKSSASQFLNRNQTSRHWCVIKSSARLPGKSRRIQQLMRLHGGSHPGDWAQVHADQKTTRARGPTRKTPFAQRGQESFRIELLTSLRFQNGFILWTDRNSPTIRQCLCYVLESQRWNTCVFTYTHIWYI